MILTITLNPAVDIGYQLDGLAIDTVNRVSEVSKTAGGKGLNVARVVRQIGAEVGASGFLGGPLGDFIRKEIGRINIHDYFVPIEGETRNCIAVLHDGKQTEILESGPTISKEEAENFITSYETYLDEVDLIAISGSLPDGLEADFYIQLVQMAEKKDKKVLLDVNGSLLKEVLQGNCTPTLIKPNEEEIADLIGRDKVRKEELPTILMEGLFSDLPFVVVTLGEEGAIVKVGDELFEATVPSIEAVNPVGSGDAVIAGFSVGLLRDLPVQKLIKYGMTMGVLNALEEKTGSINPDQIEEMVAQISVKQI